MIIVVINSKFLEEKQYTLFVLLKYFLGLNIKFEIDDSIDHTFLVLPNKKKIIIEDHFFCNLSDGIYLDNSNIPYKVDTAIINEFNNLPLLSIFGISKVVFEKDCITIKSDIVASTFYMLTRWEEYVIKVRDKNGRFPASESLAVKHNFIDRPIVNEYVEIVWNAIILLDTSVERTKRNFNFLLTHDVDLPRLWWSGIDFVKSIGGAILKRKSIKEAVTLTTQYVSKKDPFNVFDWMMDLSEQYNFTSHFFFMSGGTSKKDNYYKIDHPVIKKLISSIKTRNHKIGFHPSFNAHNDKTQFAKELALLKEVSNENITTGRHHFLRFENPTTWQIWEDYNMEWDSTMSFHDREGFRCGVCYPFPVFNILTREKLQLIERPLTVMEGSFITYQKMKPALMLSKIKKLIDTTRYYNGEFVFLWHNSAFTNNLYKEVYKTILVYASELEKKL